MKKVMTRTVRTFLLPLVALLACAGLLSTATELGAACIYTITPATQAFSYGPSNGTVSVTASVGCTWAVSNTNAWVSIASATNNTNSGSVAYNVLSNSLTFART